MGTMESAQAITIADLQAYYSQLAPENASFHVVGSITKPEVQQTLQDFSASWKNASPEIANDEIQPEGEGGKLYFIDVPDAKQSVILIGKLVLSGEDSDAAKLNFANEILGGGSSGKLFQTLRIEKGYTYGAYSGISDNLEVSPFYIRTSVRANATLSSLEIIEEMVQNYAADFGAEEVKLTQNKLLKENTRAYESLGAKLGILREISKYGKDPSYIEDMQEELMEMKEEDFKEVINEYLSEYEMIYVVVGDKATQLEEVKKLGKPVVELDIHGNKI